MPDNQTTTPRFLHGHFRWVQCAELFRKNVAKLRRIGGHLRYIRIFIPLEIWFGMRAVNPLQETGFGTQDVAECLAYRPNRTLNVGG